MASLIRPSQIREQPNYCQDPDLCKTPTQPHIQNKPNHFFIRRNLSKLPINSEATIDTEASLSTSKAYHGHDAL